MPVIIKTIDEIMSRERRDMLFVRFKQSFTHPREACSSRQRHLEWFDAKGLRYEIAAPRGWLEGDPGMFAVYFDGLDDPRVAEYSALFEDAAGKSLLPGEYQMSILTYHAWLRHQPEPDDDPIELPADDGR